jgi:hypothetical protein
MPRRPAPFRVEALEDRLAPRAGDLDLSFGDGGKAIVLGLRRITDAVVMPDNRIVVVGPTGEESFGASPYGGDFGVVRLTANGMPDPTFGTNGLARFSRPCSG